MIEVTEPLRWALVIISFATATPEAEPSYGVPTFHANHAACDAEGQRFLSVIDIAEGQQIRYACVPRSVLKPELAMEPAPAANQ
jgi:hypothetical protein